jgi:AcrR family transcriptional regulator
VSKRIGRRPGAQPTRQNIVDAAREVFAAKGFRGATVRAIAEAVDVDPGMIRHYFGTKAGLFAATLEFPTDAPTRIVASLTGNPADLGERLTRTYLELWEDPQTRHQMVIATRASLTDDEAMDRSRPMIANMIRQADITDVPGPDPTKRFAVAMAHLLGVATVRHISKVPPLCEMSFEEVIAHTAPAIQLHLTTRTSADPCV